MNTTNAYEVIFENFVERYFIKTFSKKYKNAWDATRVFITEELRFIDVLFDKSIAEYITDRKVNIVICKTEFKIAGSQLSRMTSGNRCIVAIHKNTKQVFVLLVHYKTDLGGGSETGNWKKLVKENYPKYCDILN